MMRSAWWVYGLLVLASVVFCPALFTGLDQWGRGDWDQFTFRHATPRMAMLREGQLPAWNPFVNGGNVLLAHPHCPAFSPWYLPTLVLGAPLGLRVGVVLFMALGAVGMAALLRRWDVSPAGCATGGVLLMMSAHFAMHITEGHLEWCLLGLMPWVLWCMVRAEGNWRLVILGALLLASALLHGSIYIVAVFVPVFVLWAVLESIRKRSWHTAISTAAVLGLSFLLAAVVLFPRVGFLRANPRKTDVHEQVAPAAWARMLLDPHQAELFRATRDLRNPPGVELARILPSLAKPYQALKWHRLEVEASTNSDWTDIRVEGSPFVLVPGGAEEADKIAARLDSMPLSTKGLAIKNPRQDPPVAKGRATIFTRLPEQGDLQIAVTRGNAGATRVIIEREGEVLLDETHSRRVPGDLSNPWLYAISRDRLLESDEPEKATSAARWYQLEVTLKTSADWCNVQVINCPYLFYVEHPQVEKQNPVRLSASALAVGNRPPGQAETTLRAVLLLCPPEKDDVQVRITQGRLGTSSLTFSTPQGERLEAGFHEASQPGEKQEKIYEYKLANRLVGEQPSALKTPWRWRLDELGMTRDWHEYTCYVTWLGLAVAGLGLVVSFRRQWPLIATAAVAGLIVLGASLPLNLWALWKLLPMYGSLQVPSRFLVAVVFAMAVCGGYGVDRLGRWAERVGGRWLGRWLPWGVVLAIYVELAVLGWNLFSDVFVCPPRRVAAHESTEFAQRYAEDDVRYAAMYSAHYPYLLDNSGVLREYENIAIPRGKIRLVGEVGYRGEAYLEGSRGTARVDDWSMSRVKVGLEVGAPDRLVLNQNYFPGWKAIRRSTSGGREQMSAEPSPDGLVSLGVYPTDLEVEFYYRPDGFFWGSLLSGLTLLVCLGILLGSIRGSWRSWKPTRPAVAVAAWFAAVVQSKTFGRAAAGVALNVPFLVCHPGWTLIDVPLVRSLAVNLVLFLLPGLPLVGMMIGRRWLPRWGLLWVMAASMAVFVLLLLAAQQTGARIEGSTLWNATWIVTNLALLGNLLAGGPAGWGIRLKGKRAWVGVSMFAVAYLMFFHAATRIVPVMDDHDYETQGTGYGLLTRMQMTLLTDRDTVFCYAHPPLVHFYVAGSFLYYGQKDELAYYDNAWNRVRLAAAEERVAVQRAEVKTLYGRFHGNSHHLLATRTTNVFLAALTVGLLGWWIAQMTGRWWLGVLVPIAYATNPEVFVRSSYGGYFAISNFVLIEMLLIVEARMKQRGRTTWMSCLLVGAFAGLANHKLLLLPAAVVIWEIVRLGRDWSATQAAKALLHPVALGFAAGTAAFWAYGLAVSPDVFWLEHARYHLVDRVAHINPLGYGNYPSVSGLWLEFWQHAGYVLLPMGILALGLLCGGKPPDGYRGSAGLWTVWAVLIAIVFSLIDWRQTKHLMPLLLPLHLAPAKCAIWGRAAKVLVGVLFAGLLVWNFGVLRALAADFAAFPITPAW